MLIEFEWLSEWTNSDASTTAKVADEIHHNSNKRNMNREILERRKKHIYTSFQTHSHFFPSSFSTIFGCLLILSQYFPLLRALRHARQHIHWIFRFFKSQNHLGLSICQKWRKKKKFKEELEEKNLIW